MSVVVKWKIKNEDDEKGKVDQLEFKKQTPVYFLTLVVPEAVQEPLSFPWELAFPLTFFSKTIQSFSWYRLRLAMTPINIYIHNNMCFQCTKFVGLKMRLENIDNKTVCILNMWFCNLFGKDSLLLLMLLSLSVVEGVSY